MTTVLGCRQYRLAVYRTDLVVDLNEPRPNALGARVPPFSNLQVDGATRIPPAGPDLEY